MRGWRVDAAIAVVAGVIQFVGTHFAARAQTGRNSMDALGYALLAAGPIALLVRRRFPVAVLLVVFAITLTYSITDYPRGPIFIALIVAFITTIVAGYRFVAVVVAIGGWAAFTWLPYLAGNQSPPGLAGSFGLLAWLLVLLGVGEVARAGRARAAETARTQEEEARRRASEERLRIARELHDVLAHNISLINVQAGVALHLMDEQPEQARTALTAIKQASKDALGELRSVLEVLRRSGEAEPRTPQPGLDELDELISRAGTAGLEVTVEVNGTPRRVARRCQPRRVQDRAGGGDQRRPSCRAGDGDGSGGIRRARRHPPDRRRRARWDNERNRGERQRHHGHARAHGCARRPARGRPAARWRLPGPGRAPHGRRTVISVLLADDQALVRAGFKALLDAQDDLEVVGEADDGEAAVRLAKSLVPDVVLMDIRMPVLDGLAATRTIAADERLSAVRIVILTTFELDEYVFEALRAGASGFLVKDTEPVELIRAVRAVAGGEALLSPSVTKRLIAEFATRAKEPSRASELDHLTDREREVMALVAEGLSNEEIAERLIVSPATAKTHVSRAMIKLNARDRAQLVVFAYESGLVRPGWAG